MSCCPEIRTSFSHTQITATQRSGVLRVIADGCQAKSGSKIIGKRFNVLIFDSPVSNFVTTSQKRHEYRLNDTKMLLSGLQGRKGGDSLHGHVYTEEGKAGGIAQGEHDLTSLALRNPLGLFFGEMELPNESPPLNVFRCSM
jgi:hypothetical protein